MNPSVNTMNPANNQEISPNDRRFGAGPGMFKNVLEGLTAAVAGIALCALAIGFGAGLLAAGVTFTVVGAGTAGGIILSLALAALLYKGLEKK
jgi:hypothetical protein